MIDSHCHLDVDAFAADRSTVLDRAIAAGVRGIVIPAIQPATWDALLGWPARHVADDGGGVVALGCGLGIHPQVVPEVGSEVTYTADSLVALISNAQRRDAARIPVIAVGETGLDGATGERDRQEALLRAHIRAARALRLPLLIHVLRAHDLAPRLLREEKVWECGGVMHSYSGGPELVPIYLDLGLHISFAGPVTYERATKPVRAAAAVPLDRLLLETDAPDQSPAPHRGQRNEPARLPLIAAALAAARGMAVGELAATTTTTTRRLFPGLGAA